MDTRLKPPRRAERCPPICPRGGAMDTDIDGVGEAVTGGMVARAVEPEAGEAAAAPDDGTCRNCGAELSGPYCHQCGQKARVHRTLTAFWHDLVHSVLHF